MDAHDAESRALALRLEASERQQSAIAAATIANTKLVRDNTAVATAAFVMASLPSHSASSTKSSNPPKSTPTLPTSSSSHSSPSSLVWHCSDKGKQFVASLTRNLPPGLSLTDHVLNLPSSSDHWLCCHI
jgi:hypothetical protein